MKKWLHIKYLLILALLSVVVVVYCNIRIISFAKDRLYDNTADIPHNHAALLGPNPFFYARIRACAALYASEKIDKIIVSGDNRRVTYNEPLEMKKALMEAGVPVEDIILDYAGFRTFDSVIRAKEVFGQSSFIVVSQRFHNERAVFIAGKKGIDAIGFNAGDVGLRYGLMTYFRECFARCKVFLDLVVGMKPHFLGEPVDIG